MQFLLHAIRDFPFRPLEDCKSDLSRDQLIPPVVYQTWEENSFGRLHRRGMNRMRKVNRDLSFHIFEKGARDQYMLEAWGDDEIFQIYENANFGPMKVDIFRYCLLYDRGGYYFDISKGIDVPLTQLHEPSATEIISFEKNRVPEGMLPPPNTGLLRPEFLLIQWAFGFAPGHKILFEVINNIRRDYPSFRGLEFQKPKSAILKFTGPETFTRAVWSYVGASSCNPFQVDFDFAGHGIFSIKGSGARWRKFPSYADVRNAKIVD